MDTMTPEQQHAHNALTLPLWAEWEAYCAALRVTNPRREDQRNTPLGSSRGWVEVVTRYYGMKGMWAGAYLEDYRAGDDLYEWIENES